MCESGFTAVQNSFVKAFSSLEDSLDRYIYLLSLSSQLPPPTQELMSETNRIAGCQSQVYVTVSLTEGRCQMDAYSDSRLICGVLYILRECLNGASPGEIDCDELFVFREAGIDELLSETRRKGFAEVLKSVSAAIDALMNE